MFQKILDHHIGAHLSAKGSVLNIFSEANELGIKVIACFTCPNLQYGIEKKIDDNTQNIFKHNINSQHFKVFSHACYLINLANKDNAESYKKSMLAVDAELNRCSSLGILGAVIHPGSNPNKELGLKIIA